MTGSPRRRLHIEGRANFPCRRRRRDGCTECRRKKVKCDMQKPVCARCRRYPRGCLYDLSIIAQVSVRPRPSRRNAEISIPPSDVSQMMVDLNVLVHQPSLNCSPFLSSKESKFLMHIFSTQTANMLFPAAPELFLQRMISAALSTPHLLYAFQAAASSHHSRLVQDSSPGPKVTCLKYTNLAIASLRTALCDTSQILQAETATTAMVLCTNDVCNGNMHVWRTHLRGVLRILLAFLENQRQSSTTRDPFTECLVKWFKTMDILAALSGISGECIHDPVNGPLDNTSDQYSGYVDDICGYSLELAPILAQISQLVRRQGLHASAEAEPDDVLSLEMLIEAEILETKIRSIVDRLVSETILPQSGTTARELQSTHHAFVHSALLHLHRRVQMLPKGHVKVRNDIRNILDALGQIKPLSSANILILWPIFSAGCETDVSDERDIIQTRMGNMQSLGMGNFTRSRELLCKFWASDSSLPWDVYFAQLGLELVLF